VIKGIVLYGALCAATLITIAPASAQSSPSCTPPAWAKQQANLKTNQFDYHYVEPKNTAHIPIRDMLQQRRLLEHLQDFLSPICLPEKLTLKVEGCDGVANAYFWENAIKVCYEYFEYIQQYTPKGVRQGLTPHDTMIGPTIDVFLHELGHALVEVLDIPFFGREEEAADYIGTYILLHFGKDDARRLILGASIVAGDEARENQGKAPELRLMADTHDLPAQRYFNRWCMAYGADPALFADAISTGMLPEDRAKRCRYEYQTNDFAFTTLVKPYIDETIRQKVLARTWFHFESSAAATMSAPAHGLTDAQKDFPKAKR
jgi:hypothetical protein